MGTLNSIFIPDPSLSPEQREMPPAADFNSNEYQMQSDEAAQLEEEQKRIDQNLIAEAMRRFRNASEAEQSRREAALDDLKFKAGDQWPEDLKAQRDADGRPCLTVNRLPQFLRQVTNEQRQNRPAIQINPVGSGAQKETAEILEGLIRHIESKNADIAYDAAFDFAATTGGPGWIRVLTQYERPDSFDKEILIQRVFNHFTVYADPESTDPAGADIKWLIVAEDIPIEEFKEQYPGADVTGIAALGGEGDTNSGWLGQSTVRVAEYWYMVPVERTLIKFQDGTVAFADEIPEGDQRIPVDTRISQDHEVHWMKFTASEVLERNDDYPGRYIPFACAIGDETVIENERKLSGVVRFAKDPQRAYNYWTSAQTEMIALAPKTPFVAEVGQVEEFMEMWKMANRKNFAVLPYNGVSINGVPAPPPVRQQAEPPIQAIAQSRVQAADDMEATTGIYKPALGAISNEVSGKALLARQKESDTANFHLSANFGWTVRHVGRIVMDLIPHIYDSTPRVARIIGREEKEQRVMLASSRGGQIQMPERANPNDPIDKIYDVGVGIYDVSVSTGPSYNTKRQEAAESMMQLVQAFPESMNIIGDLMVRNMDWPGSQEIARRLQKMLPPNLQEVVDANGNPIQPQIPPQVQMQIQQMQQQLQQVTLVAQQLYQDKQRRVLETLSKERIAAMQVQADIIQTQAKLQSQDVQNQITNALEELKMRMDILSKIESQAASDIQPGGLPPGAQNVQQPPDITQLLPMVAAAEVQGQ